MNSVQLVIPDLLLPRELLQLAAAELSLPALQQLLARAERQPLQVDSLEDWLAQALGVPGQGLAPYCLRADGLEPGSRYVLHADPVQLQLRGEQMRVVTTSQPDVAEAAQLCASLNAQFAGRGLHFLAPLPQRCYLLLEQVPALHTDPLAQVVGQDALAHLPRGEDALYWSGILNEIQMLLFEHALNQAREARGVAPINSLWLWGGGAARQPLQQPYSAVLGDGERALLLARAANMTAISVAPDQPFPTAQVRGKVLLVWEGLQTAMMHGDLAAWQRELLRFEQQCLAPLLVMLKAGKLASIVLDVPGHNGRRFVLTRAATWKLWRSARPLAYYAVE